MVRSRTRGVGAAHDQRRAQIADAVLNVVADRGLPAVSLTAVAAQAGVSVGRIQHYFPSKRQLVEAAFDRSNHLSSERIAGLVGADLEVAPPRTVLAAVLTELVPHDNTTRLHLLVRQSFTARALNDDAIAARLRDDYADLHRRIAELIRRDQTSDAIDPRTDPDDAAIRLVAHAEGLTYYALIGVTPPDRARDLVLTALDELYA